MSTIGVVLSVVLAIVSICLILIVLLQSGRAAGLGVMSGESSSDSYWSKNKGNSVEGALTRYTKILGALFIIVALVINFVA